MAWAGTAATPSAGDDTAASDPAASAPPASDPAATDPARDASGAPVPGRAVASPDAEATGAPGVAAGATATEPDCASRRASTPRSEAVPAAEDSPAADPGVLPGAPLVASARSARSARPSEGADRCGRPCPSRRDRPVTSVSVFWNRAPSPEAGSASGGAPEAAGVAGRIGVSVIGRPSTPWSRAGRRCGSRDTAGRRRSGPPLRVRRCSRRGRGRRRPCTGRGAG
jgi:putative serine protease PepD